MPLFADIAFAALGIAAGVIAVTVIQRMVTGKMPWWVPFGKKL